MQQKEYHQSSNVPRCLAKFTKFITNMNIQTLQFYKQSTVERQTLRLQLFLNATTVLICKKKHLSTQAKRVALCEA